MAARRKWCRRSCLHHTPRLYFPRQRWGVPYFPCPCRRAKNWANGKQRLVSSCRCFFLILISVGKRQLKQFVKKSLQGKFRSKSVEGPLPARIPKYVCTHIHFLLTSIFHEPLKVSSCISVVLSSENQLKAVLWTPAQLCSFCISTQSSWPCIWGCVFSIKVRVFSGAGVVSCLC